MATNLDDLRRAGWTVAVHNDYRLHGEAHTFWLLTKGDYAAKGEGRTDAEALAQVGAAIARLEAAARTPAEKAAFLARFDTLADEADAAPPAGPHDERCRVRCDTRGHGEVLGAAGWHAWTPRCTGPALCDGSGPIHATPPAAPASACALCGNDCGGACVQPLRTGPAHAPEAREETQEECDAHPTAPGASTSSVAPAVPTTGRFDLGGVDLVGMRAALLTMQSDDTARLSVANALTLLDRIPAPLVLTPEEREAVASLADNDCPDVAQQRVLRAVLVRAGVVLP